MNAVNHPLPPSGYSPDCVEGEKTFSLTRSVGEYPAGGRGCLLWATLP